MTGCRRAAGCRACHKRVKSKAWSRVVRDLAVQLTAELLGETWCAAKQTQKGCTPRRQDVGSNPGKLGRGRQGV